MKLGWLGRNTVGRYEVTATPAEYDSFPPISRLLMDQAPALHHDDLLAVASFIAFAEYCSGSIEFPRYTSPEVAEAVQNFMDPIWVSVSPVTFEPRANPLGEASIYLTRDMSDWDTQTSRFDEPRVNTLCVVSASVYAGHLASSSGIILSSNAQIIDSASRIEGSCRATIAVALLYCATFRASTIRLSQSLSMPEDEFDALRSLLRSCKISLVAERGDILPE